MRSVLVFLHVHDSRVLRCTCVTLSIDQSINHLIRPQTEIKIWQFKWTSEEQERQGYGTLTAARN